MNDPILPRDYLKEFIAPDAPDMKAKKRRHKINIRTKLHRLHKQCGNKCFYCCLKKGNTLDHFIPRAKGGLNAISNLVPACIACNAAKADKMPTMAQIERFIELKNIAPEHQALYRGLAYESLLV